MRDLRSGFVALLAGVVVAGMVSAPPVVGTGVGLVGSAPEVVTAVPVSRSAVVVPMAKKRKPKPTVVLSSTLKLVVDVNPDLPKSKYWKIKLQRKSSSKWRTVGIYRTQGAAETRTFGVKAGTYRVKVYARAGYRSMTTTAYQFTPSTPNATPTTPTPAPPSTAPTPPSSGPMTAPPTPTTAPIPPPPPDVTAPGVVTGLAVVGRTATSITLSWTNPPDPDLAAVIVRRTVGETVPAAPSDGAAVTLPTPTAASVTDVGLPVDTVHSYAVFTRDTTGNTSLGAPVATRTLGPSVVSTIRISVHSDGGQASGDPIGYPPAISGDGRWITYMSEASNLVDGDTNTAADVFLYDRDTQDTQRVSLRSNGEQATGPSTAPAISAEGRWITYESQAGDLVDKDTNGLWDVFLYDRDTGTTRRVSVRSDGEQATGPSTAPAISADGRWITYVSDAADLVDDDTNGVGDVFLYDRDTQVTQRVSLRSNGEQATGPSTVPAISADSHWITYVSEAADLVDDDTNGGRDVFLFERDTGVTRRVSVRSDGGQAGSSIDRPAISAHGRRITYASGSQDLVDDDNNFAEDIFCYDRDTSTVRRVSVRSDGAEAVTDSYWPTISADGRWVTFSSDAMNLVSGDTNPWGDVFLHDLVTGTTRAVSLRTDGGWPTSNSSAGAAISADGRWITYTSYAPNLVDNDTNGRADVFLTRLW